MCDVMNPQPFAASVLKMIIAGLLLASLQLSACRQEHTLFQRLPAYATGIDFANELAYSDTLTGLDFVYMYNGGGVAVGDVNNDALQDLYFSGNMVSSRLYLNRGNWQFEDITAPAGVGTDVWANGVVMVDVNQDGLKDIYVSVGGPKGTPPADMANLLFINEGNGTFTEAAAAYGLDDTGYTVQASFFDYDRDGDLDVYLLQNATVEYNRSQPRPRRTDGEDPTTDRLYRNNGDNTFTDISAAAGIQIEGFGLGVAVHDINDDGWPDVYVANDFQTDDLLYINNGDGTFTNRAAQYLKHQSYAAMGTDIADYNNDGLTDIVVIEMLPPDNYRKKLTVPAVSYDRFQRTLDLGYVPQYTRNTLQLNNGNSTFSEIGQLAGVDATDWSWSALFADLNNDGYKDLFVTNGIRRDVTDLDFDVSYGQSTGSTDPSNATRRLNLLRLKRVPEVKIPNYVFRNRGDLTFEDRTKAWGLTQPSYSNGAAYADLDNDGDLDLVVNNIDQKAFLYRNHLVEQTKNNDVARYLQIDLNGPPGNREGLGAKVSLQYGGEQQHRYLNPIRGYHSSVADVLHFGLDTTSVVDTLAVRWPDGKQYLITEVTTNQRLSLDYADASEPMPDSSDPPEQQPLFEIITNETGLRYHHRENNYVDFEVQPLLLHMLSRQGPGVAVGDANGDGHADMFVGGAARQSGILLIQQPGGTFQHRDGPWTADSLSEDLGVLFFDANGDGAPDLYVVSGGAAEPPGSALYQDRLYINDGDGQYRKAPDALPELRASGSCVVGADYDRDGDLDLFVCGRIVPSAYPRSPESYLLHNDRGPDGVRFTAQGTTVLPGLPDLGMVTAALWTDFDSDGWVDLLVTGEFMSVRFFRNLGGELPPDVPVRFAEVTDKTGLSPMRGWWNSLAGGDFDSDGDTDYLAGNLGLNTPYRASPDKPLCVHAKDYDGNGRIDPIASYYVNGERYPVQTRAHLIVQIPGMVARFQDYESYASARFDEVLSPEERKGAQVDCSERFASSYLVNLGDGKFRVRALPTEAQMAPLFGMQVGDYDGDGHLDATLVGNSYAPEPGTGRYDALIGLLLRGDGQGDFDATDVRRSGFFVDGDAKGLAEVPLHDGRRLLVASRNNGPLEALVDRQASERPWLAAERGDAYALIHRAGGQTEKREFYYGSGYLSGSARGLWLDPSVTAVTMVDYRGNQREVALPAGKRESVSTGSSPR